MATAWILYLGLIKINNISEYVKCLWIVILKRAYRFWTHRSAII